MIAPGLGEMSGTPVLENLADRQVDGIIAISPEVTPEWLEELSEQVPVVLLGRHDDARNYDTITDDDEVGTRLAVNHLMSLGHRNITHLTLRMRIERPDARPPHTVRRETYERVMLDAGLTPTVTYCAAAGEAAYVAATDLLRESPETTAIFAGNDTLAIEALRAIADLSLTASDVSVIGYDDIRIAGHPLVSLSTITQYGETMGRAAIELLMERIRDGRTVPRHREIKPELRVRSSTQPARAQVTLSPAEALPHRQSLGPA